MAISEEHISPQQAAKRLSDYLLYLRCLYAYHLAASKLSADNCVLELGCGDGYGAAHLSTVARFVIASDMDTKALSEAQLRYRAKNLCFLVSDAVALPFGDGEFDGVLAFQVLEHIEDDTGFLREAKRVLRPGGQLILTTPNRDFRLKRNQKPFNPHHVREYTRRELDATLRRFYREVRLYGIRALPEVEAIEKARVDFNRKMTVLDPFNLRRFVPVGIKNALVRPLRALLAREPSSEVLVSPYKLDVFHCESDDLAQAMDFFAVCISDAAKSP